MASNIFGVVLFMLYTGLQIGRNSALQMEIEPNTFTRQSKATIDIQCQPDSVESKSKEIVLVEIGKDPATVLARLNSASNITLESGARKDMEAKGNLVTGAPDTTYLKLTLSNVEEDDAGVYTCIIYYRDQNNRLKEDKGRASLQVKRTMEDLADELAFLRSKVTSLESTVQDVKSKVTGGSYFAATNRNNVPTNVGANIILPDLITNAGGGYDVSTGVFTAPRDGIYVFHLTITLGCNNCGIDVDVKVNDVVVERLSAKDVDHFDQSSISPVVHLAKGQEVKAVVQAFFPDKVVPVYGLQFSMFSGYFIRGL